MRGYFNFDTINWMYTKLRKILFGLLVLILVLYLLDAKFYLTWTIWWYDIILHLLSGVAVGLIILLLFQKIFSVGMWSIYRTVAIVVLGTLVVGIFWEIYEVYFGMVSSFYTAEYISDTASDLVFDVLGGLFVGLYTKKYGKKT